MITNYILLRIYLTSLGAAAPVPRLG